MTTTTRAEEAVPLAQEAEELFATASVMGSVELGVLTDEEECVLGGGQWALSSAATWRHWSARTAADRAAAAQAVWRRLARHGDAAPVDDEPGKVRLSAPLGVIEAARSHADFLVVPSTRPDPPPKVVPYGYAIVDDRGMRGIVVEVCGGGRHDYRLLSPRSAASGFAEWAVRAVTTACWGTAYDTAVVQVMRLDHRYPQAAGISVRSNRSGEAGAALFFGGRRHSFATAEPETLAGALETMLEQAVAVREEVAGARG